MPILEFDLETNRKTLRDDSLIFLMSELILIFKYWNMRVWYETKLWLITAANKTFTDSLIQLVNQSIKNGKNE